MDEASERNAMGVPATPLAAAAFPVLRLHRLHDNGRCQLACGRGHWGGPRDGRALLNVGSLGWASAATDRRTRRRPPLPAPPANRDRWRSAVRRTMSRIVRNSQCMQNTEHWSQCGRPGPPGCAGRLDDEKAHDVPPRVRERERERRGRMHTRTYTLLGAAISSSLSS